jgi:repressor LexA
MLTPKQHEALTFIADRQRATGVCPTYEEIAKHLGIASKSGVSRLVDCLCDRGFLRRLSYRQRALEVIRLPGQAPAPAEADLLTRIAAHFGPELAGLRKDCLDPDGTPCDRTLLAFVEKGEALIAEARAAVAGTGSTAST